MPMCSMSYSCFSMLVLRVSIVIGLLGGYRYCSCEGVDFTSSFMDLEYLSRKLSTLEEASTRQVAVHPLTKQLRIIDSNRFSCDGEITGFYIGASVKPLPMEGNKAISHYPRAIIWGRRDDSDYGINVRYYIKASVELKPSFSDFHSQSGIYQYFLPTGESLRFQEGDVFGVHQPLPSDSTVVLHYTTLTQTFNTLSLVTTDTDVKYIDRGDLKQLENNQYLLIYPVVSGSALSCLQGFLDVEVTRSLAIRIGNLQAPDNELRLFPDITFTQSGYITSWTIGGMLTGTDTLSETTEQQKSELQIWRPTANTSYTKVAQYGLGNNADKAISNTYKYTVTSPIPVMAGDILGVFQPSNSAVKVYYQDSNGPDNIVIPIVKDSDFITPQTINISTIQVSLANDYPLVAVNITDALQDIIPTLYSITPAPSSRSSSAILETISSVFVNETLLSISLPSTSHQASPAIAGSVDSNDDLLLSLTLVGSILILVITPTIIVILIVAGYIYFKRERGILHSTSLPSSPVVDNSNIYSTSVPNTESLANVRPTDSRESMHYNFIYYLKRKHHQQLPPRPSPSQLATAPSVTQQQNEEHIYEDI